VWSHPLGGLSARRWLASPLDAGQVERRRLHGAQMRRVRGRRVGIAIRSALRSTRGGIAGRWGGSRGRRRASARRWNLHHFIHAGVDWESPAGSKEERVFGISLVFAVYIDGIGAFAFEGAGCWLWGVAGWVWGGRALRESQEVPRARASEWIEYMAGFGVPHTDTST
jgi:hypothetical protein